jgi:hypothetical protein
LQETSFLGRVNKIKEKQSYTNTGSLMYITFNFLVSINFTPLMSAIYVRHSIWTDEEKQFFCRFPVAGLNISGTPFPAAPLNLGKI